jgi:hypothetical protein
MKVIIIVFGITCLSFLVWAHPMIWTHPFMFVAGISVTLMLAGALGGLLSARMPASGKAAIGLGMLPLLGAWLAFEFC